MSAYAIDATTGALTAVPGSPFVAGTEPFAIAVDPKGKFVYVVNYRYGNVSAFAIDATSGALTQVTGSPFASDSYADGVAVDPKGKFVYVSNGGPNSSGTVSAYKINATTGALKQIAGSPFFAGGYSNGVAIDPRVVCLRSKSRFEQRLCLYDRFE